MQNIRLDPLRIWCGNITQDWSYDEKSKKSWWVASPDIAYLIGYYIMMTSSPPVFWDNYYNKYAGTTGGEWPELPEGDDTYPQTDSGGEEGEDESEVSQISPLDIERVDEVEQLQSGFNHAATLAEISAGQNAQSAYFRSEEARGLTPERLQQLVEDFNKYLEVRTSTWSLYLWIFEYLTVYLYTWWTLVTEDWCVYFQELKCKLFDTRFR